MTTAAAAPFDPARMDRSRAYCAKLTRRAAKNFYFGLKLLPEPRRSAMFALYAYMRLIDDIADAEDGRSFHQRTEDLERWRARTHAVLDGQLPDQNGEDVWPAFFELAQRYEIPRSLFDDMIAGQIQDLQPVRFGTFDELWQYCYRVAGVVGLSSLHVWGYEGGASTEALAIDRGIAFQLTNILRDLREDAGKGRVYLPREEMEAHGVTASDLRGRRTRPAFRKFLERQIDRARGYYARSADLEKLITPESRPTLVAMTQIYRGLLEKIAERPERVMEERVSLSLLSKLRIGWRAVRAKGP